MTHANEQSTSLLAGRDVQYIPYVGVRDVPGVLRCVLRAARAATGAVARPGRSRPAPGSRSAYLPYLAARGVECHYIESAARVGGPSLTGRILRRVPRVRTYTQYRHWSGRALALRRQRLRRLRAGGRGRARSATGCSVVVTVGTARGVPVHAG